MNNFKKIFIVIMAAGSLITFAYDEQSKQDAEIKKREQQYRLEREQSQKATTIWAGVIGAVAGTAIGYWLGSDDTNSETTYYIDTQLDRYQYDQLTPKARKIKSQLDGLVKYGQNFDVYDDCSEQAIINNLYKLGIRLDQIDSSFYSKLEQEYKTFSDAGYSIWWHGFKSLENQKNLYLSNSKKLIKYFNRHQDFIYACQIINFYDNLPLYACDVPGWVRKQYCNKQYPLISFLQKVRVDKQKFMCLKSYHGQYIVQKAFATERMLDNVIDLLYNSNAYQQEVVQKRQDELLAECNRLEQERLEIAKKQARALEDANRLAAERNRIERECNQYYRDDR